MLGTTVRLCLTAWAICTVGAVATQNGTVNVTWSSNAPVVKWSKLPPTCSSLTRTACSVVTAQNLTYFVKNRLLKANTSAERAALLDDITDPASSFGTLPSDFAAEVYNFEDVCVANAREPSLVGQPLSRALSARGVLADGAQIGKQFQAAAMAGGQWVSHLDRGGRWKRTFILGVAAVGAVFPSLTPGNLESLGRTISKTDLFYIGVSYMDEDDATTECDADGGPAGKFRPCQPEAVSNLVMHVRSHLDAARSDPNPVVFTRAVEQLSTTFPSLGKNFYVSMHSISTSVCVANGHRTTNIGKELGATIGETRHQPAAKELHEKLKTAAATNRGRWVWHLWPSDSAPQLDYGGSEAADIFVDRFSFVVAVEGRQGSLYEDRYYLFSGFSDVENSGLGAPFLNGIFCKANARTGCSVTTAQNLLFDAEAALDASANPVDVFDKINTASVFPKTASKVYAWQGFLQQPIGFYVFAVNASNGHLLSYGANPTVVTPKKDMYELTESLGLVTTPSLPQLLLGYASWVGGGWIPFYWTDSSKEAGIIPRRRAYVLPWQRGLGDGAPEAYIGVGYDDMHPNDVGLPITALDFVLGSEDYSVNLAEAMVADLAKVVSGGAALINGKRYTTMQEIFNLITHSPHYKLAKIPTDPGYYAFIYFYNGTCISHGGAAANVGKVLQQILAARNLLGEITGPELNSAFVRNAEMGGGWTWYPWKNAPNLAAPLKNKYAYVVRGPGLYADSKYYIGIGFLSGNSLPWSPLPTCIAGQYSKEEQCLPCNPGFVSALVGEVRSSCTACAPGLFMPESGKIACLSCDYLGNYFQERSGASSCNECPRNTERSVGVLSAANSTSCQCKPGYWRHDGLNGLACFRCPDGAFCPGKSSLPTPSVGYYASSRKVVAAPVMGPNMTSKSGAAAATPTAIASLLVLDAPGLDELPIEPPYFLPCLAGRCQGGPGFECNKGYTGILCSECEREQFYWNGNCDTSCEDISPRGVTTVLGITAVIVVWLILNKSAGGMFECLDVGVSYLQIMSVIFTYDTLYLNYSSHYNIIVLITNIININVDFISPSCTLPGREWRYTYAYYILLIIGFLPFLFSFALYGLARLWIRLTEVEDNGKKLAKHSILGGLHLPFMCEDREKARLLLLRGLKESTPFFGVVYNNVCSLTFANFSCMTLRSGVQVLKIAPQVVCYDSYEHNVLLGISILALVVYVFGIPAIILGVTMYANFKDKFNDREWLIVTGIFYREYEPTYYWWDFVFCMRKFALCLCAVAFRGRQSTQAGIGILIIVFFALCQFVCSPFWDRRVNWLDCMCCLSIMLHLISFIYYNDANFIITPGAAAFDTILVVVNILVIVAILALFVVSAAEGLFRRQATSKVASVVSEGLVALQAQLLSCRDTFCDVVASCVNERSFVDIPDDFRLSKSDLEHAVTETLRTAGTGHSASPELIESLFHVLKRIGQDKHDSEDDAVLGLKVQMVSEFLGLAAAKSARSKRMSKASFTDIVRAPSSRDGASSESPSKSPSKSPTQSSPSRSPGSPGRGISVWNADELKYQLRKIFWEMPYSLSALDLNRWMRKNAADTTKINSIFTMGAWLGPYIPDHSSVSVYSNKIPAGVYHRAASHMPRLLLVAAFGQQEVADNLKYFMSQLIQAEEGLTAKDVKIVNSVVAKDHGPLLYWLLNTATTHQRRAFGDLLTELRPGDHAKLTEYIKSKSFGFEKMGQVLGSLANSDSDEDLRRLFEKVDEDRSGKIDKKELQKALVGMGKSLTEVDSLTADMEDHADIAFDHFKDLVRGEKRKESSACHGPGSNGSVDGKVVSAAVPQEPTQPSSNSSVIN